MPALQGETYADLARWALDLRAALEACNADKAALREWAARAASEN